jgi:hypothetical protein
MDPDAIEQLKAGIETLTRLYERARDEQDAGLYYSQMLEQIEALQALLERLETH